MDRLEKKAFLWFFGFFGLAIGIGEAPKYLPDNLLGFAFVSLMVFVFLFWGSFWLVWSLYDFKKSLRIFYKAIFLEMN